MVIGIFDIILIGIAIAAPIQLLSFMIYTEYRKEIYPKLYYSRKWLNG